MVDGGSGGVGFYFVGDCFFYYWDDFSSGCGVNLCNVCEWGVVLYCVGDCEGVYFDYLWYVNVGVNFGSVLWFVGDWGIYWFNFCGDYWFFV